MSTQNLTSALNAMLTYFGMDEDEWSKPVFDQARAALASQPAAEQARLTETDFARIHRKVRGGNRFSAAELETMRLIEVEIRTTMASQSTPPPESAGQGLSDAEIDAIAASNLGDYKEGTWHRLFARAILAANRTAQPKV